MKRTVFKWSLIMVLGIFAITGYAADVSMRSIDRVFPEKIGTLVLIDNTDYEKKTPGLGESLSYRAPGISADIYVYDFKIKDIPEGANSEILKKHFSQVAGDVFQFGKTGKYKNVNTVVEMENQKISGVECLWQKFSFVSEGTEKDSYLYLTGLKGKFLKMRITHAARETKFAEEAANFASKVFEIVGKKEEIEDKKQ